MFEIISSLAVVFTPAIAGFFLFLLIRKNNFGLKNSFFQHYLIGFSLATLIFVPIVIINLGVQVNYNFLLVIYFFIFFTNLFSYFFFYRGSALYFTKERFFNTALPLIWVLYSLLATFSLSLAGFEYSTVYNIVMWGFILPVNTFLSALFFYFFVKGSFLDKTKKMKERLYMLFFCFGWLSILILDGIQWGLLARYPSEFWIIKIAALKGYFIIRALVYLLIFIGCLAYSRHLKKSKGIEKNIQEKVSSGRNY